MLPGINVMGADVFAAVEPISILLPALNSLWNEICPNEDIWTCIEPDDTSIERCQDGS